MTSNTSFNLAELAKQVPEEEAQVKSRGSASENNSQQSNSMSGLNCSLNLDEDYFSSNLYSEHKSLMKSKISGFEVDPTGPEEASPEQLLDYLVNLNKLLKVKTHSYRKKFLRWKETNFYKVG